jgi:hypothetical protein
MIHVRIRLLNDIRRRWEAKCIITKAEDNQEMNSVVGSPHLEETQTRKIQSLVWIRLEKGSSNIGNI